MRGEGEMRSWGLVAGAVIMGIGAIGWISGYIFSQKYFLDTGHTEMYDLGHIAFGVGPAILIGGMIIFTAFYIEGYFGKDGPPSKSRKRNSDPNITLTLRVGKYCSNCGTLNHSEAIFCMQCGRELPSSY
jgi:hypothetical protein